jgi:lia operon protein LiaG
MRRFNVLTAVLAVAVLAVVAAPHAAAAEVTRTLKADLASASGPWFVENLAGSMKVVTGAGPGVAVVATVHAESDAIADLLSIEQVAGGKEGPGLRVKYPVDTHTTYRYPRGSDGKSSGWLKAFGSGTTNLKYDGTRVAVSGRDGVLLYADIEVQVPARAGSATLKNHVGSIQAKGVEGTLAFESGGGDIDLDKVGGTIRVETGSGDVVAHDGTGSLSVETGSGDVNVERFSGESIACDVGSGDVNLRTGSARKVKVETGSGDVELHAMDAEEFVTETGSGDVLLEAKGARLAKISSETGSGDITLRLGPDATFLVNADQGSGDLVSRYSDAQAIIHGREVVGYKRGDGHIQIDVTTGSGDVVVEPAGKASV